MTQRGSISSLSIENARRVSIPVSLPALPSKRRSIPVSTIQDRSITKNRGAEVSLQAWAFMFSELVQYTQRRVDGISDFEKRLGLIGYRVGMRLVELLPLRESLPASTSRSNAGPSRITKLLPILQYIHTPFFKFLFNKPADALEKSNENEDEYMLYDNDPVLTRAIHVPAEMSTLSCSAITAGIIEAVLDGWNFPARVTAHSVPSEALPRRTVFLIKLDAKVMQREEASSKS